MLLAVVELPQLSLLLLLKLHVSKRCAGLLLLFVIVCRMTQFVLRFIAIDSSVFFSLFKHELFFMYPRGSVVACTASIYL